MTATIKRIVYSVQKINVNIYQHFMNVCACRKRGGGRVRWGDQQIYVSYFVRYEMKHMGIEREGQRNTI